jgi:hypothetical protein
MVTNETHTTVPDLDDSTINWAVKITDLPICLYYEETRYKNGQVFKVLSPKYKKIYKLSDNSNIIVERDSDIPEGYTDKLKPSVNHIFYKGNWELDSELKDKLVKELDKKIEDYLEYYTRNNFKFNGINFNGDKNSCIDVNSTLSLKKEAKNLIPEEQFNQMKHTWRRLLKMANPEEQAVVFSTFTEFTQFAFQMGIFYANMFEIRSYLKDRLYLRSIDELISYNIENEWNNILNKAS